MDWNDYCDDDDNVEMAVALDGKVQVHYMESRGNWYGYLYATSQITVDFNNYATVAECKAAIEDVARKLGVVA